MFPRATIIDFIPAIRNGHAGIKLIKVAKATKITKEKNENQSLGFIDTLYMTAV